MPLRARLKGNSRQPGGTTLTGIPLSTYADSTDNNFSLIRLLASVSVVLSHGYTVVYGTIKADPLWRAVRMTMGSVAVDVFFVVSGFLVTRSLLSRRSVRQFIRARMLRIFPAQVVAVFLTVAALFFVSEEQTPMAYLSNFKSVTYVMKNVSLVTGYWKTLPGVFIDNPYGDVVNAALWSLPYELWMYMSLAAFWIASKIFLNSSTTVFKSVIAAVAVVGLAAHLANFYLWFWPSQALRLISLFFVGAAFFIFRSKIVLSGKTFLLAALVLSVGAFRPDTFFIAYHLLLPYLVLFAAYVPDGRIRLFNRIGDLSYGTYIYSFPVQQTVVALSDDPNVWTMFWLPLAVSLALAAVSWHKIEKRALALKNSRCVLS